MPTVLIVEDEKHICQFISINLKARGYDTLQANSAEEGLQLWKKFAPDALILDIKLPGMNGWSMLKIIDNDPTTSKLPVIIMTASSVLSQPDEYPYPHIIEKLIKPISVMDLVRPISAVFQPPG
ncbi:MAG: response regulator transcription factor [Aggregatilineales bacterium]